MTTEQTEPEQVLVKITTRLTMEDWQQLRDLAQADDRSLMNYTRRVLEDHLATAALLDGEAA